MKSCMITVNGNVYDVTVEEKAPGSAASTSIPQAAAAQPAPAPAPTPAPQLATAAPASAGEICIEAGAAGKVVDIAASPGDVVARGDTVVILEVMKMETPVVAHEDGTVASIEVAKGQSVAAGELLATMN